MRIRTLALTCAAIFAAPAAAQDGPVKIAAAKIGLPPGRAVNARDENNNAANVYKSGVWAPVYVRLEVTKETKRKAAIVVESKDSDGLGNAVAFPLMDLTGVPPGTFIEPAELPFIPYVRASGISDEVVVSVRVPDSGDPANWRTLGSPARIKNTSNRDPAKYIVLSLGTNLPGFDLPTGQANANANQGGGLIGDTRGLRGGRVETAAILDVALMPDQWFGYEAADLIILTTGATDPKFLDALFADPARKPKLDALFEYVRRGGKLVISVGTNAGLVSQYEALKEILPAEINRADAKAAVTEVNLDWDLASRTGSELKRVGTLAPRQGTFPVANLLPKPDVGFRQLVPRVDPDAAGPQKRVVVQAAYGLGRVTLVAIDLDRSPFTEFDGRAAFWDLVVRDGGSNRASVGNAARQVGNYNYGGYQSDQENGTAKSIRDHVDTFEGVPVISFGWVAVFIVLYTLLIGPVEYFVLKKVFKRLELTWVTFPIIVLTVSAIAYFSAYALKGSDLKVNKMDLVDVDGASGRVYGKTWFTLFSPRIENYTITVRPADGWVSKAEPPLVDWLGGDKGTKASLFSRRYTYNADPDARTAADGLIDVPIQVWSTKAFTAEWAGKGDPAAPLVVSNLTHPPADRTRVTGTFTLNLPLKELTDVRLIYAGKAYKYENPITPGATVTVFFDKDKADADWLTTMMSTAPGIVSTVEPPPGKTKPVPAAGLSLGGVLFHEAIAAPGDAGSVSNSTLRRFDQSWRLTPDNRNEVIVVGRAVPTSGPAEPILTDAGSPSPTVLWLKGLPAPGKPRPPVAGNLQQETYVRVFVPVRPAAGR